MMKNILKLLLGVVLLSLVLASINSTVLARPNNDSSFPNRNEDNEILGSPSPVTIDQVTHNIGNIVTTVDNHGYIGGYWPYLPSGEWPRNSGHDYLGDLMYWMGAITPGGDTLVANTWDEFQGMPSIVAGASATKILLSTDTTRYWNYNLDDTVGLGYGNPALGWRQWSSDSSNWLYVKNYDPAGADYYPGGPQALQVSHYRFNDAADGAPLMGLEMTHTMLQWNYCYNENFIFVILDIKNASTTDYTNFAFGLYVDIDVGGPDGTGENGRLNDKVAYDTALNLAWTYDVIGTDPGWGPNVTTGVMGTKILETPDDIGMTAFRTSDWALVPDRDPGRYELINSEQWDTPLPPTDQYYLQCVRGIDMPAGKTIRVVYALVAGANESDFIENAERAQQLYDDHFIGPQPPIAPKLQGRAADEKVYLFWDDTSKTSVDPRTGERDFAGYKLYRSDNQGKTWGSEIPGKLIDNNCLDVDYYKVGSWGVLDPDDPIPHSFIDTGLLNGVEYWYCLVAYDWGDTAGNIDALQNGFGIAGEVPNVIAVRPRPDPAGFYTAAATVKHDYFGSDLPSEGNIIPIVYNMDSLISKSYRVTFEDTPGKTYWHLIDEESGDTILANQSQYDENPESYPIVNGIQVIARNGDRIPRDYYQSAFGGSDTTMEIAEFEGPSIVYLTGNSNYIFTDEIYRPSYELRYTGNSTVAPSILEYWYGALPTNHVPFEVWNTQTNERVSLSVYDETPDGSWDYDEGDMLAIVDYPYDSTQDLTSEAFPYYYSWIFAFDPSTFNPVQNDVFTIEGAPVNGPDDMFSFSVDGIDATKATNDLAKIKVVPNPYIVSYSGMVETTEGEAVIYFQNVPDDCTIRIYTLAGDLVMTLDHDDVFNGAAKWNLLNSGAEQIASGIYIYHVESPYGERLGRFAVIK